MIKPSEKRWRALCAGLGASSLGETTAYDALIKAYLEPHRAYHTLAHLDDCLQQFDAALDLAENPYEVEAALWFHDAIYDTHRSDNEEQSAAWAVRALSAIGVHEAYIRRIATLILATRHDALALTPDSALLVDIDLSILGRSMSEFDRYEAQIRQEYSWVDELSFRSARAKILQSLIDRRWIYQTAFFRDRYEVQARANLSRSLRSSPKG